MDSARLLLRRLKNRDHGLSFESLWTPIGQRPHLKRAAYHAQNLRNASSLKGLRVGYRPRGPKSCDKKNRSGVCLTGPIRSHVVDDVKGEDGVGFRVEEKVVRVHCVDFARHEIAPLVAFVSR